MSVQSTKQESSESNSELDIWKAFFPASEVFIKTVLDCARYWEDQNKGLRELFFFLCEATADSYRSEHGFNDPKAPLNVDLNSVRQSLYALASTQATFDPLMKTAYFTVRFDAQTGNYNMAVDLTYKGKVHLAKINGLIKTVRPSLVCKRDMFTFKGKNEVPMHVYPKLASIKERGGVIGAYCLTTRPNGETIVNYVNQSELEQLQSYSNHQELYIQWPAKMALKSAVNQAERDWYTAPISPIEQTEAPLRRLVNTKESLKPFLKLCDNQDQLQKLSKVVAYAMTFFPDQRSAQEEGENMLMLLTSQPELLKCKPFSIAKSLMACAKYGVSLSKTRELTYLTVLKEKVHTAEIDLMYQGMRDIAFSGITNTSQKKVTKLDVELVFSTDKVTFEANTQIPHVLEQNLEDRGQLLGGFVVVTRDIDFEVNFVSVETMDKVASCSRSNVKSTWPKHYARKTLLRQTFSSWL